MTWVGCCPCCGGKASLSHGEEDIGWNDIWYVVRIKCDDHRNCGVQLELADRPSSRDDNMRLVEEAVSRWNRRPIAHAYGLEALSEQLGRDSQQGQG